MNLETFLSNFSHVANAPDGVKSLRQLVMASALAGKFSLPNEELPTDIQVRLDEARLVYSRASGKREKPLVFGDPLIQEFDVPLGWKWVRVGQICDLQTGATPSTQRPEYWGGEIPWLASGDVNRQEIFECEGRITDEGLANSNCKILPENSVLIALNGQGKTRATVALLRIPAACNQSLVAMIPFDSKIVTPEYLFLALRYRYYEIRDITGQDQRRGLNMGLVSDLSVPLAPLSEQKRIVAKVDELMSLCDQLEAQQQERKRLFPVLSRTCHASFAEAPTPANLNRIFDETENIFPSDLRKTILTLAVSGRILPQNSEDESASILLRSISEEKRRLVSEKKIRHQEEAAPIAPNELPFDVPKGWAWARLSTITRRIQYGFTASAKREIKDVRLLRITDIQDNSVNWNSVPGCEIADDDVPQYQLERGDILVARTGGTVGKTYLMREVPVRAVFASYLIRIQGASALLDRYLKLFLESPVYWVQLDEGARGGAQPNVNGQTLGRMVVPIPPFDEQHRIVAKVDELMSFVDHLEAQQQERDNLAEAFAKACVASFTGTTQLERPEKMKAPKTELVSLVTLGKKPKPDAKAPLAQLLIQNKGTLPAKSLWQQSGLTIDKFYQQLKTEIAQGWIAPPAAAEMKILEEA